MKNKLIAWILVVVMLCLALSGCAYNYQKQDWSEYASYDKDALYTALTALTIEDAGFTGDETTREQKVAEEIYERLVETLDDEDAVKTGVIADGNVVAYCYYVTATFGEGEAAEDVVLYAANMAMTKARDLAIHDLEDLDKQIGDALIGYDFVDGAYDTDTASTSKATAGSVVYVSYSYQKGNAQAVTVTNERITLPAEDDGTFAGKLIGKSLLTTFAKASTGDDAYIVIGDTTYSSVKINWQVKSGSEITVVPEENPFADTTTKTNDTNGTSRALKDAKNLTYHIYPVSRTEVPTLTSAAIIRDLLGEDIATSSLPSFTSEEYKFEDATLKALIADLVQRYKTLSDAETAYEKDKSDTNKAALDAAEEKVNDTELSAIIAEINNCVKTEGEGESATVTKASDTIVTEYEELVYDELEEEYNTEIKDAVAHEIWHTLSENVTINEAPKRAVKEAYDHNYESYKYEFYEGTKTTDLTNKDYYGTLKTYIAEGVAPELATEYGMEYPDEPTYDDAVAVLERHAEEQVKEIMLVYIAAEVINAKVEDAELTVAKSEIESYAYTQSVFSQYIYGTSLSQSQIIESYGENNIRTGLLFEKLLTFLLETEEEDDARFVNITVIKTTASE